MSDQEPEARRPRLGRQDREQQPAAPAAEETKRGELSPAQYDDDGWGDTPVQMRG